MNDRNLQLHDEHVVWDITASPRMWNQTLKLCKGNETHCEEVVFDAQIVAIRRYRAGRYDPTRGSLGAWVWEIVKSTWKSSVRRYKRRGSVTTLDTPPDGSGRINVRSDVEVGAHVFVAPWRPRPFHRPDAAVELMQRVRSDPKALAVLHKYEPTLTAAEFVRELKRRPAAYMIEFAAIAADLLGRNDAGAVGEDWLYWRNEWSAKQARDDAPPIKPEPEPGPVTIIEGPLPADVVNGNLPRRKFKTWAEYDAWLEERHLNEDARNRRIEQIAAEGMEGPTERRAR